MARYEGKSERYPGVYWNHVKRLDGKGQDRVYYISYRRTGSRKSIEEKIGRASDGWNEAKVSLERGRRIAGKANNTERRENERKLSLQGEGPLKVGRLWQVYLNAHQANKSIRDDANRYNRHIEPRLGNVLVTDLKTDNIVAVRRYLEKQSLSPQSVKHCLALVKRIIRYAVSIGLIHAPDNLVFDMPKFDNQKTENMTAEQLIAYWQALDEEPDQDMAAMLRIALLTGIRRSALFALQWTDCDFGHGVITLQGEHAKNGKTARLPMNDAVKAILNSITRTDSPFVFPGMNGEQRKTFTKMPRRVRERAGLPKDFRPLHGLRHTFASMLASTGKVSLFELKALMTHGSLAMTQRYAHLADEALRRAANVAGEALPLPDMVNKGNE